ncbi:MAG TPA: hypothetical protein VE402_00140, partial [Candidatus Angelobacter sp.]|nr:hypothetical protein [Candidatus Angelobacter sp.]
EFYLRKVLAEYPDSKWTSEATLLLASVLERQGRRSEAVEIQKNNPPALPKDSKRKLDERLRGSQASEAPG